MSTASDPPKSLYELFLRWLLGQETVVVLLFVILLAIGWLGYYGITTAMPEHLTMIQNGYKENATVLREAVEKCCSDKKDLIEIIKKDLIEIIKDQKAAQTSH